MDFEKKIREQMKRLKFKNEKEFLDFLKDITTISLTKQDEKRWNKMWKNIEIQRKKNYE